ncbi:WLM domain-containing protein [Roridomyces roridus]|uniref:WLM domain-containing protein n=1 Tax=Roridomyces roridus TaxID=1738132 RepID=A0AAD7CJ00_9AGAR|nr:WLM domain-containing protein [Roridomyces roridus]
MVHVRLNERETNPNPHCNFISALPAYDAANEEDARQLIRALAAQVRPVMKAHGFVVNSLEEYENNKVFAGRNWNNGEVVELVLRRADGSFLPTSWLMSTFCHELAHIKHMNHGPAFQALWKQLRAEVRDLQNTGYYGDGYWSSGSRLFDSARVTGDGIEDGDFPEYMCGGAHSRARPTGLRRRKRTRQPRPGEPIASLKTGAQTAKKRKAGARVTSKYAFTGEGTLVGEEGKGPGTGFGKQAGSKRAREERALAAERRIQALQKASTSKVDDDLDSEDDSDEPVGETDAERREALLNSANPENTPTTWKDFDDEFQFNELIENDDIPIASGSTFTMPPPKEKELGIGHMVQSEINLRKKESLGMAGGGKVLGGRKEPEWACTRCTLLNKESFLACSACAAERE